LLLARNYGFPSWRALKQEVDRRLSLQRPAPAFTLGYQRVVWARSWDTTTAEGLFYHGLLTSLALCQLAAAVTHNMGL